jgi:hypothetical protein
VRIADDTWVLVGRSEDFSLTNGGNIVNTAFIVTQAGVVVIDSGPSRAYGEQLKRAIARITDKPVSAGAQHPSPPGPLPRQPGLRPGHPGRAARHHHGIHSEGGSFNENMYRLAGDWMAGTEPVAPTRRWPPARWRWAATASS